MKKKTGRPPKATAEEKISIVNQYYICKTNGNPLEMISHGIYSKLSEFAKEKNFSLEPHDFAKDQTVRDYIRNLATQYSEESSTVIPVYEPLDITALMALGRVQIEKTLRDREAYYESLHVRSARAVENYALVVEKCAHLQSELELALKENDAQTEEKNALTMKLREAQKEVGYLRRVIRKDVEPERAQQYLQGLTSREAVVEMARESVMTSIKKLTEEDKKMKLQSLSDEDVMDLNSLFR